METTKKQIKKVLLDPRVRKSVDLARAATLIKRNEYKHRNIYYEILNEVIEDLDKILFLIALLNLEEELKENK